MIRIIQYLLLPAILVTGVSASKPPSVHCEGIYCRETEDRDWHVRITGEIVSPAGIYVIATSIDGHVLVRRKIPRGEYPAESPYQVTVPKDGVTGDYLLTVFGKQKDLGGINLPYTDLPFEVYGKEVNGRTFLHVMPYGSADGLYFKLSSGVKELTITQGNAAWTLLAQDGSVVFDVREEGEQKGKYWTGAFTGEPGKTYRLGKQLYWFFASPRLYVAASPDRWFEPDRRLTLDPSWWRQGKR